MITHMVLMKPRPDLTAADRQAFVAAFERALREIPGIRNVRIGHRVRHGAGYEHSVPDIDYVALIDFDDLGGVQTYLRHPAHTDLGMCVGQALSLAMVYDFETGGIETLRSQRG